MSKSGTIGRLLAASLAAALLLGGVAVVPASAAESYSLGSVEAPKYVMNDHTPFGVRFSVDTTGGLEPNTSYYMKVRFSPIPKPQNVNNRGFTWNEQTGVWVQERGEWLDCPTVTTDADGSLSNTWIYGKFGDETNEGDYYLIISLSATGSDSTYNSIEPPLVTVLDAATEGSWIHNADTIASNLEGKRLAVRDGSSTGDADDELAALLSLWEAEANGIDDDGNGLIDDANENQGPIAALSGDYRSSVPSDTVVDIYIKRGLIGDDFTTGPADCDIAVDADDTTPPTAATEMTATLAPGIVELAWEAATDMGGSGLAGYNVYRWPTEATVSLGYTTNAAVLIGTTTETSFTDTTADAGVEYAYRVRAVDDATNVGPRSNTATAVAIGSGDLSRDFGDSRYDTALAVSRSNFPADSVESTVVIATGRAYADALAASSLAGVHGSPLLLVGETVSDELLAEIDRLGATDVVLIGGTLAVPQEVEDTLAETYNVKRVSGDSRYETAAAIAREVANAGGNATEAYFVRSNSFADAIAISPFAYSQQIPVLLVQTTAVPEATAAVIDELGIAYGMIPGGMSAVDADTEADLETLLGAPLVRWAGTSRYDTAALVARYHVDAGVASYNYVGIATGAKFPDALGGGAAAGINGGVLLLTKVDSLAPETAATLTENVALIDEVHVFGGLTAVTEAVYTAIANLLP
ncbi:MAG: cell wall-binding repeat-containing protein [Coriobacteriia bacterium]|nr:cell wall-binding repeat-containing protein [Coriobacteriia bacterium]